MTISTPIYRDKALSAVAVAELLADQPNNTAVYSDLSYFAENKQLCRPFTFNAKVQSEFM